jgi:hypothetical protein
MPTTDGFIADLSGSTVFSKLDLVFRYHQFELFLESRYITTFSTHIWNLLECFWNQRSKIPWKKSLLTSQNAEIHRSNNIIKQYMEEIRKRMTPIYAEYLKHLSNTPFVRKKSVAFHNRRSSFMVISLLQGEVDLIPRISMP